MIILRNPHEMARVAKKFSTQEDTLEAVRKLLIATMAMPWFRAMPPDFVADFQETLGAVEAATEDAQTLRKKLDGAARRAEELELTAAREFESGLSAAFDPLLANLHLLERCRAARVAGELTGMSLGGLLPATVQPGVTNLGTLARALGQAGFAG